MSSFNHDSYDPDYIRGILDSVKTVAIVGASANEVRPSFFVTKYMIDKGYTVYPINPGMAGKQILGRPVFASSEGPSELFKVVEDGRYAIRSRVQFGRTSVSTIEVLEGLEVGDEIILSDMSQWDGCDRIRLK